MTKREYKYHFEVTTFYYYYGWKREILRNGSGVRIRRRSKADKKWQKSVKRLHKNNCR